MNYFKSLCENNGSVGLMVGRFQPLTKAHTQIIETISKENDSGIIFLVKGKDSSKDKEKNPFDVEIQQKLLKAVLPGNMSIVVLPSGFFVDYINELPESTFNIYAGTDRIKAYESFTKYMAEGKTLSIKEIVRGDDDISATKVRNSLKEDDIESFKKLTDARVHKFFEELKGYL
jgi:cytidyltransferase-like protein